jgi:hypothetical protein
LRGPEAGHHLAATTKGGGHGDTGEDEEQQAVRGAQRKGMSKERAAKIANSPDASRHGGKKSRLGRQLLARRYDRAEEEGRPEGGQGGGRKS